MNTIALTYKRTIYENILLDLLLRMPFGSMRFELPNGEVINIGNGEGNVSANIRIKNSRFFKRCILYGDIGFGESYVDGDWETDNITNVIKWFLLNIEHASSISGSKTKNFALNILKFYNKIYHWNRANSVNGARKNISDHYDLNNHFFQMFLDPSMTYSSAYFLKDDMSLEQAQCAKYDRLCQQLQLKASDHVLEIGSGWGGNAIYMAKNYGCKVTTITISEEQYRFAKEKIANENLSDKVTVQLMDYRYIQGHFDKIVSIEMLEAVGHKFLDVYFKKCHDLLKKDGILAMQVITCPDSRYESLRKSVDWIQKHIFHGTLLPSIAAINYSINRTGDLHLHDLKDLGLDYEKTLSIWNRNFNDQLDKARSLGFNDTFIRKWNYYLSYCEAAFAMRNITNVQLVYRRPNNLTEYKKY